MADNQQNIPDLGTVDVYPVGVLHDLLIAWRALTAKGFPREQRIPVARYRVRTSVRYLRRQAKAGEWRAVRQSFNGYLAEPRYFPAYMTRCGHGWTRRRAARDLARHQRATYPPVLPARDPESDGCEGGAA